MRLLIYTPDKHDPCLKEHVTNNKIHGALNAEVKWTAATDRKETIKWKIQLIALYSSVKCSRDPFSSVTLQHLSNLKKRIYNAMQETFKKQMDKKSLNFKSGHSFYKIWTILQIKLVKEVISHLTNYLVW